MLTDGNENEQLRGGPWYVSQKKNEIFNCLMSFQQFTYIIP